MMEPFWVSPKTSFTASVSAQQVVILSRLLAIISTYFKVLDNYYLVSSWGSLPNDPNTPAKSERLTFTAILHHSSHLYLILNLYLHAIVCLYLYLVLILKYLFPL